MRAAVRAHYIVLAGELLKASAGRFPGCNEAGPVQKPRARFRECFAVTVAFPRVQKPLLSRIEPPQLGTMVWRFYGGISSSTLADETPPRSSTVRKTFARVLVVDDDVDSADITALLLENAGHATCVAYSAQQALHLALGFEPDVAVLDLSLGVVGGYELAEAFRVHESLRGCRFVAVTGHVQEAARRQSEAAGFHRHLTKPVDMDALLEAVAGEDERPSCAPAKGWTVQR